MLMCGTSRESPICICKQCIDLVHVILRQAYVMHGTSASKVSVHVHVRQYFSLAKKVTIHQVTTMLATSIMSYCQVQTTC